MAIQFPYPSYARKTNADWLIGATSISFACWASIDDIQAPAENQYVFSHRGATGQYSFRLNSNGKFRFSVTNDAGVFVTKDSTTTPVEGTVYRILGSWEVNDATGLRMWLDGSEEGTGASTTTQSGTYQPGTASDLWFSLRSSNNSYGRATIEGLLIVKDYLWTADDVAGLEETGYPWHFPWHAKAHVFYPLNGALLSRVPDWGGGEEHIEAGGIGGTPADGGAIGKWRAPWMLQGHQLLDGETGTAPTPWTEFGTGVLHSADEFQEVITGLSNGTAYEFMVRAEDQAGNLSADSAIVTATPQSYLRHVPRNVWWPWRTDTALVPVQNLVHCTGFETGGGKEIKRIINGTASTTYKRSGLYSMELSPTGGTNAYTQHMAEDIYGYEDANFDVATVYCAWWCYVDTLPTTDEEQCAKVETTGAGQKLEMRLRADGKLELYDSTTTLIDTSATALAEGTEYILELKCGTGADAPYELRIDGVTELSGTANLSTTNVGVLLLGRYNNRNSEDYTIYIDDVRIDTVAWPEAIKVKALAPTADGSTAEWTASAGDPWDTMSDVPNDGNTTYTYSSTSGEVHLSRYATMAQAGISGKAIRLVKPIILAAKPNATATDMAIRIISGGTTEDAEMAGLQTNDYDLWMRHLTVDPDTGAAWTEAAVDAFQAGGVKAADSEEARMTQNLLHIGYLD